jgi:competence CoiA-like predicted nuclease
MKRDICKPTDEVINGMAVASDIGYCIPPKIKKNIIKSLKKPLKACPTCENQELKMRALGLKQIPHYWCPKCDGIFMIKNGKIWVNKDTWL